MHTRLCVACAGVPVVYALCYEHTTLCSVLLDQETLTLSFSIFDWS